MTFVLLLGLAAIVVPSFVAHRGIGHRGAWVGFLLLFLLIGIILLASASSFTAEDSTVRKLLAEGRTFDQIISVRDAEDATSLVMFCAAFGSLLAICFYRKRPRLNAPTPRHVSIPGP